MKKGKTDEANDDGDDDDDDGSKHKKGCCWIKKQKWTIKMQNWKRCSI